MAAKASGKERIHGTIAHKLGVLIISGHYQPGQLLDNEVTFSEQLAVSRSAYREAMRTLTAKGLVESRPKTGTRVSDRGRWHLLDPEVLAWFFEARPSLDFIRGLFELRMLVEPEAAALAAARRQSEDLSRMRKALQRMEKFTLAVEEGRLADRDFHDALLEATRNPLLIALSSSIGAAVQWTTIYKQRHRSLPRDPVPDHWRVFDAIAVGSADEARASMQALVELAHRDTDLSLEDPTPGSPAT
ncbi:MAG: FadR/GntR family transcriptional regulator [Azospirillaceae bacterium]|nr:FadR/GntR family transcriptional regulator [Azospirillaceae bacterium]